MPTFFRNRAGFTLMELLVVISIIVVLAGMLMAGIAVARNMSRKAKTTALIQNTVGAIERYRALNSVYPEAVEVEAPPGTFTTTSSASDKTDTDNNYMLWNALSSVDGDSYRANSKDIEGGYLIDIWGKALHYRPFKDYPYDTDANKQTIANDASKPHPDGENPPNPDTFQLWSSGPDTINYTSDDIANW